MAPLFSVDKLTPTTRCHRVDKLSDKIQLTNQIEQLFNYVYGLCYSLTLSSIGQFSMIQSHLVQCTLSIAPKLHYPFAYAACSAVTNIKNYDNEFAYDVSFLIQILVKEVNCDEILGTFVENKNLNTRIELEELQTAYTCLSERQSSVSKYEYELDMSYGLAD